MKEKQSLSGAPDPTQIISQRGERVQWPRGQKAGAVVIDCVHSPYNWAMNVKDHLEYNYVCTGAMFANKTFISSHENVGFQSNQECGYFMLSHCRLNSSFPGDYRYGGVFP